MIGLHWLDLVVLGSYFAVILAVGLFAASRIKGVEDYYMGGRRFGKAMMIMFAFGCGTHADSAVGVASETYQVGIAGLWYQWSQLFNTPIYWLLSPIFRRARCLTTGDLYELRYGPWLGVLYACWGIVINIGFLSVALFGSGKLVEAVTGGAIPVRWSVFLMTFLFVFYSFLGGMIAAVWNEFIQGTLTIIMSILLVPFLWDAVGGRAGFLSTVPHAEKFFRMTAPGEIGLFWIVTVTMNQVLGYVAQPHIMSNNAAGRTELDNRIGLSAGMILKRVCAVGWAFVGVLAIAYYGYGKIQPDHVFGSLIRDLLPTGFAGLMLACIIASVMDIGSVLMLSTAALFTRNLLPRFKPTKDERQELLISRFFSLAYVSASICVALSFSNVPSAIRFMWELLPMIGIPFWLGLWWKRANRYGAIASSLVATIAWIVASKGFGWTGDTGTPYVISFYLILGIISGVVVSLVTKPESQSLLDRFYLTINTPIGQEDALAGVGSAPD